MSTIALVGYYGFGNYGDELFVSVFEKFLPPGTKLTFLHGKDGKYPPDLEQKLQSIDAVIVGGGDLVIPFWLSPLYWDNRLLTRPTYIYGVGVPLWGGQDEPVLRQLRVFFQHPNVRMVATRDRESRDWVEKNLQPVVPVEWYPDLACSLPTINVERASKTFGIITRQQSRRQLQYNTPHQTCLRRIVKVALERNYRIKQIILATGETQNNDLREAIEDLAYSRDILIRTSIDELTKELISCSHIISMRFHGCVMGLLHHIPVLALSRADKFVSFYQDCGLVELQSFPGDKLLGKKFEQLLRTEKINIPSWIPEKAREGIGQLMERINKS